MHVVKVIEIWSPKVRFAGKEICQLRLVTDLQ